ncbi:MAG: cytidine deaminase [Clostridiaceae bacterium]|nr:cytidine deaminase [Clostridiaceae bacterium]
MSDTNSVKRKKCPESPQNLIQEAFSAKNNAYAPYSGFNVGAALIADDGNMYTGCNVENSSYGATICAERTAIVKAISNGAKKISSVAVVSDSETYTIPCAICLQVMSEFCDPDMELHLANRNGQHMTCTFNELLPHSFKLHKND